MEMKKKSFNNSPISSLYIHIPFCRNICYYCDFSKVLLEGQPVDDYLDALIKELRLAKENFQMVLLETVYIGGGTPSLLEIPQLSRLFFAIKKNFAFAKDAEFTFEANPEDLSTEKVKILKEYQINRVSLGVQTFDNQLLRAIGRKHTDRDVEKALFTLKKENFTNISLDLIYALPGQTLASLQKTLAKALTFDLPHYSIYSLIIERQTIFARRLQNKQLSLPDEDETAAMFDLIIDCFVKKNWQQYEISNFAKKNFAARHNLVYWNNEHYLGIGAGASGYYENIRYKNHGPIRHYLKALQENKLPIVENKQLTLANQMEEEMFLGLRKLGGVSKKRFSEKFQTNFADIYGDITKKLIKRNLLEEDQDLVKLSKSGLFLGNEVFSEFLT